MIDPKNDILLRVFLVYFVVALVGLLVILGIVKIQVKDKEELLEKASKRELKFRDEKAHRGNIMSKNGTLLSTSVPRYSIHFDPMAVNEDLFKSPTTQERASCPTASRRSWFGRRLSAVGRHSQPS